MKSLFWEIAARLGFWIPCHRYMPPRKYWDWVLIGYREPFATYYFVPSVAEYSYERQMWHDKSDDGSEDYLNNHCLITHWHRLPRKLKVKTHV